MKNGFNFILAAALMYSGLGMAGTNGSTNLIDLTKGLRLEFVESFLTNQTSRPKTEDRFISLTSGRLFNPGLAIRQYCSLRFVKKSSADAKINASLFKPVIYILNQIDAKGNERDPGLPRLEFLNQANPKDILQVSCFRGLMSDTFTLRNLRHQLRPYAVIKP